MFKFDKEELSLSNFSTCQAIASPSRSGSVAKYKLSDFFAASVISLITFLPLSLVSHFIWKSFSVSIASFLADKSLT